MKSRLAGAIVLGIGLLASGSRIDAAPKLALRVTPSVSTSPATVVVTATVPKNAENRVLEVTADSGSFYRSSEVQLEGESAPLVTQVSLKNLPSGEYEILVVLRDSRGQESVARSAVMILAEAGER
jgi:hypothetical protein